MSKKTHRKPAAFRVEEVDVFVPPTLPDRGGEPVALPVPRSRTVPDLGRGPALGQHLASARLAVSSACSPRSGSTITCWR